MVYKVDYLDDDGGQTVLTWSLTPDGHTHCRDSEYTPTFYVSGTGREALDKLRGFIDRRAGVVSTEFDSARTVWRNDPESVLQVDVATLDAITDVASEIRGWGAPGEYKLYNVDLSREFRYCLENDVDPTPRHELSTTTLSLTQKQVNDGSITPMAVDGTELNGTPRDVLEELRDHLKRTDPDVLILSASAVIPLLYRLADRLDAEGFSLSRLPGRRFQELAGESTYQSYGRVSHSPARYNLPGRVIIDRQNSFFMTQSNLAGLLDLVERSRKPLQEAAWSSIGNVLTAVQIREADKRGVVVPWNSWRHEFFKPMSVLHEADRGGFIFSPRTGLHEDVHELDFSSLYPNIIVTRNVSPDTIRCDCHADRDDVPGLGYAVCDDRGYLADVLEPIIADRTAYKTELATTDDDDRRDDLQGRSDALKWILVACFGYQGFSNAKFGRIECHEAINAYAREILLDAKECFESHGWEVIHGIVDSVWVTAMDGREKTPLDEVTGEITELVGIDLEYEAPYDWVAFVPRSQEHGCALTKYFGKVSGTDEFKKRGIEVRQRSTPAFIADCQKAQLRVLDESRAPEAVCDLLKVQLSELRRGAVDPGDLLITQKVSKPRDAYEQYTRGVAALDRATTHDFQVNPGEKVQYVVVDDEKRSSERVHLEYEELDRYDTEFYGELLVRATESIVSPLGWDRDDIRGYLSDTRNAKLGAYGA